MSQNLITRSQAIIIANFAQPTSKTAELVKRLGDYEYQRSLSACIREGYVDSAASALGLEATESGRAALVEFMATPGMSFR